ncbi:MAG: S4 domain-containing protein, partial [Clostridiales bacterium]|nr:S4 domain-containing protein [Clostridiales bacterium]
MRLQKYLAGCGAASRRKCEEFITAGRVTVNGAVVTELGTQVEEGDAVTLDGKPMLPEEKKYYILYHKPMGEVCTASDPQG